MKLHPRVSQTAVDLAKRFEGFRPRAGRTPEGRFTIGYGHILGARDKPDQVEISEAEAEFLLKLDLSRVAVEIEPTILTPVNDNQFAALLSFAFNIGTENFKGCSALRRLNEGAYLQAAAAIELWRRAEFDGEMLVVDQLVRRRAVEKALFLAPPEGFTPAPSAMLRPAFDHTVIGAAVAWASARERTAVSRLALEGPEVSAGLATPPGREGEPAPSAPIAAADALAVRLSRVLPESLPEPEDAPAFPALESETAPLEAPAPQPATPQTPQPPSEPTDASIGAFPAQAPPEPRRTDASPFPARPASEESAYVGEPPAILPSPFERPLFVAPAAEPVARNAAAAEPQSPPFRSRFGTRLASAIQSAMAPGAASALRSRTPLSGSRTHPHAASSAPAGGAGSPPGPATPLFERPAFFAALGGLGAAFFVLSIFCMLHKASFACLLLGVVGVLAMVPSAAFFLFHFLDRPVDPGQWAGAGPAGDEAVEAAAKDRSASAVHRAETR